jgi:NADH:ubiquinone oxidoreductase subunit K
MFQLKLTNLSALLKTNNHFPTLDFAFSEELNYQNLISLITQGTGPTYQILVICIFILIICFSFFVGSTLFNIFFNLKLNIERRFLNVTTVFSVTAGKPVDQEKEDIEAVFDDGDEVSDFDADARSEEFAEIFSRFTPADVDVFVQFTNFLRDFEQANDDFYEEASYRNVNTDFIEHYYLNFYALSVPQQLLFFSFLLFLIGLVAFVFNKSNMILLLISLEIMLLGVSLSFIFISLITLTPQGQIYALIILAIAAAESAIGLALIIAFYRLKAGVNSRSLRYLKD